MKKTGKVAIGYAFGAAALYALNVPLSKYLLRFVTPTMMAALLYLGAGFGIGIVREKKLAIKAMMIPLTSRTIAFIHDP